MVVDGRASVWKGWTAVKTGHAVGRQALQHVMLTIFTARHLKEHFPGAWKSLMPEALSLPCAVPALARGMHFSAAALFVSPCQTQTCGRYSHDFEINLSRIQTWLVGFFEHLVLRVIVNQYIIHSCLIRPTFWEDTQFIVLLWSGTRSCICAMRSAQLAAVSVLWTWNPFSKVLVGMIQTYPNQVQDGLRHLRLSLWNVGCWNWGEPLVAPLKQGKRQWEGPDSPKTWTHWTDWAWVGMCGADVLYLFARSKMHKKQTDRVVTCWCDRQPYVDKHQKKKQFRVGASLLCAFWTCESGSNGRCLEPKDGDFLEFSYYIILYNDETQPLTGSGDETGDGNNAGSWEVCWGGHRLDQLLRCLRCSNFEPRSFLQTSLPHRHHHFSPSLKDAEGLPKKAFLVADEVKAPCRHM